MAHNSSRITRRQACTFSVAHNDWSTPQEVTRLGSSGRLSRLVVRGPAGSTVTELSVKVWAGEELTALQDPDTVTDEWTVLHVLDIPIVGDLLLLDLDLNILQARGGASYDLRGESVAANRRVSLWIAIEGTGGTALDTGFVVALEAIDVE